MFGFLVSDVMKLRWTDFSSDEPRSVVLTVEKQNKPKHDLLSYILFRKLSLGYWRDRVMFTGRRRPDRIPKPHISCFTAGPRSIAPVKQRITPLLLTTRHWDPAVSGGPSAFIISCLLRSGAFEADRDSGRMSSSLNDGAWKISASAFENKQSVHRVQPSPRSHRFCLGFYASSNLNGNRVHLSTSR